MDHHTFDALRLTGRRSIVTGAASGIGEAIARKLVARGARVVIADIDLPGASKVAAELGPDAIAAQADVSDTAQIDRLYRTADEFLQGLDILVNNAGISEHGPFETFSEQDWDRQMAVNAKSAFLMSQRAIPRMRRAGRGAIVNVASLAGIIASPQNAAYNASKAALILLGESAAIEFRQNNIRVNSILPGLTLTPTLTRVSASSAQSVTEDRLSLAGVAAAKQLRMGQPEDHAELVAFLVSDAASFITGAHITIDGGLRLGVV